MPSVTQQRISSRLKELGLSAGQASLDAGLSRSLLGKFIRGDVERMRDDNLRSVADVLKCSLAWLKGETDLVLEEPSLPDPLPTFSPTPPVMSLVADGPDKARIHVEGTVTFEAALAIMDIFRKGQIG